MNVILGNQETEVTKASLGLDQVDNTSDENKPISAATQSALDEKQEQIDDKLAIAGGTMTGNLILNADPVYPLQGATKQYVDDCILGITFDWGDETADADATWWAGLKGWLASSTEDERAALVGKTKSVTLTDNYSTFDNPTHLVRCIGYDCDGTGTLTFQTEIVLDIIVFCTEAQYSTFEYNALWRDENIHSLAKEQCFAYYNTFPGKDSIKAVIKKYNTIQSGGRYDTNCDKSYSETVFIPSENEMGFHSTSICYGSAKDEACIENTGSSPFYIPISYQYYSDDTSRMKQTGLGSYVPYWTKTRFKDSIFSECICYITADGDNYYTSYDVACGFAPAFAIG